LPKPGGSAHYLEIQSAISESNAGLARHGSIQKFAILPAEFSVRVGELTPSLKLKRRFVELKYAALFASFYEGAVREL
jgi:long-chain acyl-CoA synthetase